MVTGRAPSSLPFRGSCPESTCGQSRMQNYQKRPENIGDNAHGQGAMAWVDPTGYPTETQQKRTCLRIPAQSRLILGAGGMISGTPTQAGNYSFTVQVNDSSSPTQSISQSFNLTVSGAAPLIV